MTTVRFSKVVAECGKPQPYTLWLRPENDSAFQKALKENRVLSVHQETTGAKADYGEVGYTGAHGELLVFPRSLKSFEGRRVVGVKYDLLDVPEPEEPALPKKSKPAPKKIATKPVKEAAPRTESKESPPQNIVQFERPAEQAAKSGEDAAKPDPSSKKLPPPKLKPAASGRISWPAETRPEAAQKPGQKPSTAKSSNEPSGKSKLSKNKEVTANQATDALPLLRQAMRELKDGKAVKAYESLQKLETMLGKDALA